MLYWINFLHIYQPPTQDSDVIKKVAFESYAYILDILENSKKTKLTLNISGSLIEKLQENNLDSLIERFKKLISRGQLELTGSAMYHPILPLINEEEIIEQIKLNNKKLREVFGDLFKPEGFYLPEMAYSEKVGKIIKNLGFKWILLGEMHFEDIKDKPDSSKRYKIKDNGMTVIFRDRKYSKSFAPRMILENFEKIKSEFLITAHDGELYGHWHKDYDKFLNKIVEHPQIENILVSDYLSKLNDSIEIFPKEISWESVKEDIESGVPYALWDDPKNEIHQNLWQIEREVYNLMEAHSDDPNYKWSKFHYHRGVSSCFWWWASEKKVDIFSPISWNPSIIESGALEFLKSIRSLNKLSLEYRIKFEEKINNFRLMVWKRHWTKLEEKNKNK